MDIQEEAKKITGPCTCDVSYTSRLLLDPNCRLHELNADIVEALHKVQNEAFERAAQIAGSRRDKEYNSGKFNASCGTHDWVVQYHNGAAFASSEIAMEIRDLKSEAK